jgi:hypothetical protein
MHAHPADPESLGDGGRPLPSGPHLSNPHDRHGGIPTLVDAFGLGSLDARVLALADALTLTPLNRGNELSPRSLEPLNCCCLRRPGGSPLVEPAGRLKSSRKKYHVIVTVRK